MSLRTPTSNKRLPSPIGGYLLLVVLVLVATSIFAGPLEDVSSAYAKGDYATVLRLVRPLAEQGNPGAQSWLGILYFKGNGVRQDYAEALKWFRKGAEQNNVWAQVGLGMMYRSAKGVTQDSAEALKWYRKAAEQGNALAQSALGMMYRIGEGVPQDYAEALKWFRRGAEQGNAPAQYALGMMYEDGTGVPQDYSEAVKWYHMAAEQSYGLAQSTLGMMYRTGKGVPQDYVSAYLWFNLAATNALSADEQSSLASRRQEVAGRMTTQQIARAQELSSQWQPKKEAPAGTTQQPQPNLSDVAPAATGTGFYVSKGGHVLTNAHVVERCGKIRLRDPDGTVRGALLTARDAQNDLVLLKSAFAAPAVATFTGRRLQLGQPIVVYGFPLSGLLTSTGNLTTGSVAGLAGPGEDARLMQISAPIQPGNSGSPVLDTSGNVLGVAVSKLDAIAVANATEDIPQNVNFAIKGSLATNFLESRAVDFVKSSEENTLSAEAIGARAMRFTVRVECLR
jgi:TPR repeat protein